MTIPSLHNLRLSMPSFSLKVRYLNLDVPVISGLQKNLRSLLNNNLLV